MDKFAEKMQVQKEHIADNILREASRLFFTQGYWGTSMREIAKGCGIAVGNIYNYYPNKDELFRMVTMPAISAINKLIKQAYDEPLSEMQSATGKEYIEKLSETLSALLMDNRQTMSMLLLKSNGSSLENFVRDNEDAFLECLHTQLRKYNSIHPDKSLIVSDEKLRLSLVRMFSIFQDILRGIRSKKEAKGIISLSLQFEFHYFA